jgi:hypothetical protein
MDAMSIPFQNANSGLAMNYQQLHRKGHFKETAK